MLELTFKQTEATLMAALAISPDRAARFRSRIKQLQRLGFPPGSNVGRGPKMAYDARHLFQLVTAFEIIGLGVPAERAVSLVIGHWDTIAAGFAVAQQYRFTVYDEEVFLLLTPQSLSEIRFESYQLKDSARIENLRSFVDFMSGNTSRLRPAYLILSIGRLFIKTVYSAQSVAGIDNAIFDAELSAWRNPAAEKRIKRFSNETVL